MAGNFYQQAPDTVRGRVATVTSETHGVVRSVTLNVAGQRITVRTDQDADYLNSLANDVNGIVDALRQAAPGAGLPQLMALTAMQLADRAVSAEAALQQENLKVEKHIDRLSDRRPACWPLEYHR